jgi:hypothetical protein
MAKTKRRSRNIARKPKSRPSGFVPQNASAWSNGIVSQTSKPPSNLAANATPESGRPEPESAPGFVPQNASASSNGFVPQNSAAAEPSSARAATNRANAQHSTGPRTDEGKARSSQNARKHGLSLQRHAILRHEDPAAYNRLREELAAVYEPASPREHLALEEIAHCRWALHRFDQAEAALLEYHFAENADPAIEHDCYIPYGRSLGYTCIMERGEPAPLELPSLLLLHRYRTHWDRRHQRALAEFDRARKDHRQQRRDAELQEAAARKAEREAAAERRREELHQLRLAEAQAKLAREQARATREETRSAEQAAREAAKTAAQQSKSESNALFDALERYLNTMPNAFDSQHSRTKPSPTGFVPQNRGEHANDAPHSHAN